MAGVEDLGLGRGGGDAVAELERFIAETEARGESVPLEAYEMLARLRELMAALHGLTASLQERRANDKSEEEPGSG